MGRSLFFCAVLASVLSAADGPNFTLEGTVVNSVTGEPVRRAAIAIQGSASQDHNASISADIGGHFVLENLPAGDYTLSAEKQGFAHAAPVRVSLGSALAAVAGVNQSPVTIKLLPLGRISGKVVDENGDPILNANVQLFHAAIQNGRRVTQPASGAVTNDLGEYHVASLQPGRYFVSVTAQPEADGASFSRTFYGGGTDLTSASPIELQPGGAEHADLTLRPVRSFSVRGTIVNLPENMHPYLNISRRGSLAGANEAHATQVDPASGDFEFRGITPGDWIVTAGCFEKNAQLFGTSEVVVSNADSEGLIVALAKANEITGSLHVESSSATPPNPRAFSLSLRPVSDGSQPAMGAMVGEEGNFTLSGVQPGEYMVVARTQDPWYVKSVLLGGTDICNSPFSVSATGTSQPLTVTLATGGGEINGSVVEDSSAATKGVVLLLGHGPERTAVIDALGKFRIGSLPPGDYTAYAFPDLRDLEYNNPDVMQRFSGSRISVTEGAKQQVELKLNRTVY